MNTISPAVVLPNDTIVVAGVEDDQPVMKRFDTRTGEKLNTAILPNLPLSLTLVHVSGMAYLALATRLEFKVQLHLPFKFSLNEGIFCRFYRLMRNFF